MTVRKPDLSLGDLGSLIDSARGLQKSEIVIKSAKHLNVFTGEWVEGDVAIAQGRVVGILEDYEGENTVDLKGKFLVPGFIDSHVHIESTMMTPGQYERVVLTRGTTGAIVDPHEMVNVLGKAGFDYFLESAEKSTMDIYVMLSSCVPATNHLETSGAKISAQDLLEYKDHPKALGLAEMMNFPGLLNKDPEVLEKITAFQDTNIDGHCPMLSGKDLNAYIAAGVKSCHESIALDEAKEKLQKGMLIQLREGSVAKNLKDLCSVLNSYSSPQVTLATDDRNPVDILDEGHIDFMIKTAIEQGLKPEDVYRAASWSTANAYGLTKRGAIAPGYFADIVVLNDYMTADVHAVLKDGMWIRSEEDIPELQITHPKSNSMKFKDPKQEDLHIEGEAGQYRVIEVIPDQIVTKTRIEDMQPTEGLIFSDTDRDILKIAVLERHGNNLPMSKGLVHGFGFKKGAIGSSVGHDSHNAVVVGTNDKDMLLCYNWLKENGGGFVAVVDGQVRGDVPLPIAGLMTDRPIQEVYERMTKLRVATHEMGGKLHEPFLQLAFLCLPVIPELKITDLGLVDVNKFELVGLRV